MIGPSFSGRKAALCLAALLATVSIPLLAACAGPTSVVTGAQPDGYQVSMSLDPPTLNPPQVGSLVFTITDSKGKLVKAFDLVYGAIIQNVTFSKDLRAFRHSYTQEITQGVDQGQVAVQTSFPESAVYNSYTYFQPAGAAMQTFTATIATGQNPSSEPARLAEDTSGKLSSGVLFTLLSAPNPLKAGQPAQLAFHVTERGQPVTSLWPLLGAAGHLWIINQAGTEVAHETGAAQSTVVIAGAGGRASGTPIAVPTFAPEVRNGLATITAAVQPTLLPAQKTAQRSVLETPVVQPGIAYGPDVIFTHTFPKAGMYKLWLETQYRNQVITVDYVVKVEQ